MPLRRAVPWPSLNDSSFHSTVAGAVSSCSAHSLDISRLSPGFSLLRQPKGWTPTRLSHGAIWPLDANRWFGRAAAGNHPPVTKRHHIGAGAYILGGRRVGLLDRADCRGVQYSLGASGRRMLGD